MPETCLLPAVTEEMPAAVVTDPTRTLDDLEDEIATLSAHIDAATSRLLRTIAEFDRREGWACGFASCAHWLSYRVGLDLVTAREKVRVARALEGLPKISQAFEGGKMSYSKVRAMTRFATPDNEEELLRIARDGTASHLERVVRGYRRARRLEEAEEAERQHEERFLHYHTDDDGMLVIEARLPPEVGACVVKALEAAMDGLRDMKRCQRKETQDAVCSPGPSDSDEGMIAEESKEGESVRTRLDVSAESSAAGNASPRQAARCCEEEATPVQLRADALGLLAEAALGKGLEHTERGEAYHVAVHVDAETLADPGLDGRSEVEPCTSASAESSRRLACDAPAFAVVHGADGEVLRVGRKSRRVSLPLWRVLAARDETCRFPGCARHRHLQAHHVRHWASGGDTSPENLILLCRAHHRVVHEVGYGVELDGRGGLTFLRPDGRPLPASPGRETLPADPTGALAAAHRSLGLCITAQTNEPGWDGQGIDLDLAVEQVIRLTARGRRACASPGKPGGPRRGPRSGRIR